MNDNNLLYDPQHAFSLSPSIAITGVLTQRFSTDNKKSFNRNKMTMNNFLLFFHSLLSLCCFNRKKKNGLMDL